MKKTGQIIQCFGLLIFCGLYLFANNGHTQIIEEFDDLVNWSDEGMIVFVSDGALSPENPQEGRVEAVVYRKIGDEEEFSEIARMQRPESLEEFTERAGDETIQALLDETELNSAEELWEYVKANPKIDHYGFLGFDKNIWRAFGTAYFDHETRNLSEGTEVTYQVRYLLEDGSEAEFAVEGSKTVGAQPSLLRPVVFDRIERENVVGGKWVSPVIGSEDALFAYVFRQQNLDGVFERLPDLTMARRTADSLLVYQWEDEVEPERAYRYYIQPMDIVGNTGPVSDTLTVISVDFQNLPLMGDVSAVDTTSGIHLSWDPIPNKAYINGIEIRRSRTSASNYIVLDTLSVTETEFLDTRVVPNIPYFYEFRIVSIRNRAEQPSGVARATFRNEDLPPSPPVNLRAEQEESGIRLNWDPNPEPDMFGYYVYRGTSRQDSMAVISQAIRDTTTFFDDSEELDGRTNYVYSVQAINLSELESDFSNQVVIRPDRPVRPPEPVGISGYAEQNRIRISWRDVKRRDGAVEGYHIYRGTSPLRQVLADTDASITALQNGYDRLNDSLITATSFDDVQVTPGQSYYYAVSSLDLYGVESELSNTASFIPEQPSLLAPSQISVRTVSGGVELRWNQTRQESAVGYRIYRRSRGDAEPTVVGTTALDDVIFTDTNTRTGSFYWYSLSVITEERESPRSREQSVRIE